MQVERDDGCRGLPSAGLMHSTDSSTTASTGGQDVISDGDIGESYSATVAAVVSE